MAISDYYNSANFFAYSSNSLICSARTSFSANNCKNSFPTMDVRFYNGWKLLNSSYSLKSSKCPRLDTSFYSLIYYTVSSLYSS